jgi:pyruvate,water dikinase
MRVIALGEAESLDATAVGHKAANLARFAGSYRVPPAFCLPTSVYAELKAALTPEGAAERAALRAGVADGYARLAARLGVPEPRVAVRSSATGEDSAEASYAGQHETILDVRGVDAVVEAVLECWRSVGNERVAAYRKEKGIDASVEVAVLVQQMVDADASAIAFGADPVSGDDTVVVIDGARGLGDKIASGEITPDRYHVRKDTLEIALAEGDALSEHEVREIARLVLDLERENGHAVDVECAYARGELYLLQCRPITTLAASFPVKWDRPEDAKLHWRRDDAHVGAAIPRLVTDYMKHAAAFGLRRRAEIDDLPVWARMEPFFGRTYVAGVRRTPERDMAEHGRSSTARVRARARGFRKVWDEEFVPKLRAHYEWFAETTRLVPSLPLPELADRWDAVFPRVSDIWVMHMLTTGAAYTIMDELAHTYETLVGGTTAEALKITQARAPSLHRLARDMHALVNAYRSGDSAAFERARDAFVAEHGNLGSSGEDMRELPWAEDPALLRAELERRAAIAEEDPDVRAARLIAEGEAVVARARAILKDRPADLATFDDVVAAAIATGPLTEEHNYVIDRQVQSNVGRLMRAVGARMAREGLIAEAADVFLFHVAEISASLREARPMLALERERAAEYAGWRRLRHPPILGSPTPPFPATPSNARVDLIFRTTQDAAGVIKGQPASSGIGRGRARLVRGQRDFEKMKKGDVLVCRSSNVSWIPLFTIAAAIVTDVGGSLSHAAVVAREFGVPAVVGTGVALQTLRDGQLVEVDGDRGTVRSLD